MTRKEESPDETLKRFIFTLTTLLRNSHNKCTFFSPRRKKRTPDRDCRLVKSTSFARIVFNEVVDDGEIFIAQSLRHHHTVDVMRQRAKRYRRVGLGR